MGIPELEIVVAAAVPIVPRRYRRAAMRNPLDISHEMRMVRAALLYGDRVSLASWRVSMVNAWARLRDRRRAGDAREVVRLLAAIEWGFLAGPEDENAILGSLARVPREEMTLDLVETAAGDRLKQIDVLLDAATVTPGWLELSRAVDLGVVDIRAMGQGELGFSVEAGIAEYLRLMADVTEPTSGVTPMLDYSAAGMLAVGSEVGLLKNPLPRASSEVALAAHYVGYLPTFESADLTAVLKARESLSGPLVKFRSVIGELAREIESMPTQEGFDRAADDLFRRAVAPQLDEVARLSRERSLLRIVRDEVADTQGGLIAKAGIGLAAASVAGLPELAGAAVGALTAAGEVASGAYRRRRGIEDKRSSNRLLWMYEVERRLTHGHKANNGGREPDGRATGP